MIEAHAPHLADIATNHDGLGKSGETLLVGRLSGEGDKRRYLTPLRFGAAKAPGRSVDDPAGRPTVGAGAETVAARTVDYRGKNVLVVARNVPAANLDLITKVDLAEIFAPAKKLRSVTFLLIGLNAAALLLATFLVARSITKPLRRLAVRANRIASGEAPPQREARTGAGELGDLAQSIGQMEASLRAANRDLEHRVSERTAELARSNRDLEQFAYIASHDLKEPLRMVTSYVQLLEMRYGDQLDDEGREFVGFAVEGASRMKDLINDLLAYSRISTKGNTMAEFAPTEAAETALLALDLAIEDSGASVEIHPLPLILGDARQITQLFQNLIGNAIKFAPAGEAPRIEISAIEVGEPGALHTFEIRDHGIGIDPEYREAIFQIFKRLNRREDYEGTGIGLSICQRIVERHGGEIWVADGDGGGTRFRFTLRSPSDGTAAPAPAQGL